MKEFDWNNITNNEEIVSLLKKREEIENKIISLDQNALVKYELEKLDTLQGR